MPYLFLCLSFFIVFVLCQRSIAFGLISTIAVGYFSGIIRANYQSIETTFLFDSAIVALYASVFLGHTPKFRTALSGFAGQFVLILILWPLFLAIVPVNHYLVQLVALRGNVWLLPLIIIAMRLKTADVFVLTRGFAILNIIAMGVGVYLYINGVESLYPRNDVTRVIYNSQDVVGGLFRIPSVFLSAHAYGGTMVLTIPFLLGGMVYQKRPVFERGLFAMGLVGAVAGILFCAARQPLWMLGMILVATWVQTGMSLKFGLIMAVFAGSGLYAMSGNERFQRGMSLHVGDGDRSFTFNRIYGSVNEELFETILALPLGAGMGTSVGTSIPYFLSEYQPEAVGAENEYSRIAVDQGWIGLGCWLFFLAWCHLPRPTAVTSSQSFLLRMIHSTTGFYWATAFIGTGTLTSIPSAAIMLISLGFLINQREVEQKKERALRRFRAWKIRNQPATAYATMAVPKRELVVSDSHP